MRTINYCNDTFKGIVGLRFSSNTITSQTLKIDHPSFTILEACRCHKKIKYENTICKAHVVTCWFILCTEMSEPIGGNESGLISVWSVSKGGSKKGG